ncbi:hypothetical protein M413DRAFT_31527 [Hebeloma cylindrosporum]|uniref:BHLH domain-containing protein n=1 Tax=Hebeloma cylindrosporum TaxID=76867 RepID=A0A0C3BXD0_HEBCY|nr:hypothetical protein M413DRAFT_31527 [Hebeloma cylindrosporum h7]
MSFFSSSPYKPQIRQEGFSPTPATNTNGGGGSPPPESIDSPTLNNNSPGGGVGGAGGGGGGGFNDLFSHSFLESASTSQNPNPRKYPSSSSGSSNDAGGTNMDFGEELASLMSGDRSPQGQNHHQHQNQYHHQQDEGQQHRGYGPSAHNIFDGGAMLPHAGAHPSSVSSTASLHSEYHGAGGYNMRYEPVPEAGSPALSSSTSGNANPPPSAFHHFSAVTRHTPSPIHSSSMHSPSHSHSQIHGHSLTRSRSRSRPPPPTVGASSSSLGAGGGGVGPARTTRARRNNSVSGTSPPPAFGHHHHHGRPHPHAIVIPGSRSAAAAAAANAGSGGGSGWFHANITNSASEFSLPTPPSDVLHHSFGSLGNNNNFGSAHNPHPLSQHHSHSHSLGGQQYTPFSLSPPASSDHHTLPPVSSLHSPLYASGGGGPKSPSLGMDFSLNNFGGVGASAGSGHTPLNLGGVASSPMIASPLMTQGGFGGRAGSAGNGYVGSPSMSSSLPGGSLASSSSTLTGLAGTPNSSATTANGSNNANANVAPTTSTAPGATAAAQDKQSLLANEKRRRRRESHNAVERRRRDNINEKISELATLIPECMLDATASGTGGGSPSAMAPSPGLLDEPPLIPLPMQDSHPRKDSVSGLTGINVKEEQGGGDSPGGGASATTTAKGGAGGAEEGGVVKANKGMILRKSVEYIRYLQQLVTAQGARNRELERELSAYRGSSSNPNGGGSRGTPSDSEPGDAAHGSPPSSSALRYDNREQPQEREQEMMLHDGFSGMLPSMPEGEGEEEDGLGAGGERGVGLSMNMGMGMGMGMDVDRSEGAGKREERGRTRGVRRNGGVNGSWPNLSLKEEDDGPDGLGFMHAVGMQS